MVASRACQPGVGAASPPGLTSLAALVDALADVRRADRLFILLQEAPGVTSSSSGVEVDRDDPGPAIGAYVGAMLDDGMGFDWSFKIEISADR